MRFIFSLYFILICLYIYPKTEIISYNIINYDVKSYEADMQNWDIMIEDGNKVFVGNNNGLLVFDGNNWELYPLPNKQTIRAIHKFDNKIFTAGDNNFGYWIYDNTGNFIYTSLKGEMEKCNIPNDNYWSLASDGNSLYAQSFSRIIEYKNNTFKQISTDAHMLLQETDTCIYTHKLFEGIYKLKNGEMTKIIDNYLLENGELKFYKILKDKRHIFGTSYGHIFIKDTNGEIRKNEKIRNAISPFLIDCAEILYDEYIVIGTLGGGVYIFDLDGELICNISGENYLQDKIIHRIKINKNQIWATLDNGVSAIELNPEIAIWKKSSTFGRFSSVQYYNENLYIGTNLGLYKCSKESFNKFELVKEVKGEVLCIKAVKDKLLCSTKEDTYLLDKDKNWIIIEDMGGIYDFIYEAYKGEEYLISPSYTYISYMKYQNDTWEKHNKVRDIVMSFDKLTPENLYLLWAIHPQNGIFRIKIKPELNKAEEIKNYKDIQGLTDYKRIFPLEIDGNIYFFSPEGVFQYFADTDSFVKVKSLSEELKDVSGMDYISHISRDEYWIFKDDELLMYRINGNEAKLLGKTSFLNYNLTPIKSNIKIENSGDNMFFTSTIEGLVVINGNVIKNMTHTQEKIRLNKIEYINKTLVSEVINDNKFDLPAAASNLNIYVSKPISSTSNILRYRLHSSGSSAEWSKWSKDGIIRFVKLPIGDHVLEIEDYYNNKLQLEINVYPPFYISKYAIAIYIILLTFLAFYITRRYQHKKRSKIIEQHKIEQKIKDNEITRLNNEKLKTQIETQKKEINDKLRALSQKQEILLNIDNELDRQKQELGDRYPKKMYEKLKIIIENGMSNEKDFILFQNYYQEVNHDFIIKLKDLHPELSSGELKFCSLVRSNLSTKDIAAILNITTRGVEIKKYRIKKKLNIEENLYDYILKF